MKPDSKLILPAPVPREAAVAYADCAETLKGFVNQRFADVPDSFKYIGNNPVEVMHSNHSHHVMFMSTIFKLNLFELLANTIPWVYRAYSSHGFHYDYFIMELTFWKDAVDCHLAQEYAEEVNRVYDWMLLNHTYWIEQATQQTATVHEIKPELLDAQQELLKNLLAGDHRSCLKVAHSLLEGQVPIADFYLMVVQPSMYDIGVLWEKGQISVAQEHLATSIMSRVMAEMSRYLESDHEHPRKAVITSCPNEYHELGGWMVSDLFEADGWSVRYLGANMPADELLKLLDDELPDLLAISATMPFHIELVADLIAKLRKNVMLRHMKVLVGGQVFNMSPNMWKQIGADGYAANAQKAVALAQELCG